MIRFVSLCKLLLVLVVTQHVDIGGIDDLCRMDESGSLRAIDGMGGTGGTGSVSGASAMAWHGCHWQTEIWAC